jgi:predicted dehydrogenase
MKRILIIGGGRMGLIRAAAFRQLTECELVLVEPNAQAREAFLGAFPGSTVCADVEAACRLDLGLAVVATPPALHAGHAMACAASRVPVLIEKPSTLSEQDAAQLAKAVADGGRPVVVGYHNRARQAVRELREAMSGRRVMGFASWWVCSAYARDWWHDPSQSGGGMFEQGCHMLDLVGYVVGDLARWQGAIDSSIGSEQSASLRLVTGSGRSGTFFYSSQANSKDIGLRVFTADGVLELKGWDMDFHADGKLVRLGIEGDRNEVFLAECSEVLGLVSGRAAGYPLATLAEASKVEGIVRSLGRES